MYNRFRTMKISTTFIWCFLDFNEQYKSFRVAMHLNLSEQLYRNSCYHTFTFTIGRFVRSVGVCK
jgi:hypothetical protein